MEEVAAVFFADAVAECADAFVLKMQFSELVNSSEQAFHVL